MQAWVDDVAQWPFRRIIPCHLANDVAATPADFRRAFNFLRETSPPTRGRPRLVPDDFALLARASAILTSLGVVDPPAAGQLAPK